MREDDLGIAQVGQYDAGSSAAREQRARVHVNDRVIVHVNHAGPQRDLPGHLVHVPGRGNARADVDELPYPRLARQEPHRPLHERPVRPRHGAHLREVTQDLADSLPVSGIVIPAAKERVIHPGGMRLTRIDLRSGETGLFHRILPARHGHGRFSAWTRYRQAGRLQSRTLQDTAASVPRQCAPTRGSGTHPHLVSLGRWMRSRRLSWLGVTTSFVWYRSWPVPEALPVRQVYAWVVNEAGHVLLIGMPGG